MLVVPAGTYVGAAEARAAGRSTVVAPSVRVTTYPSRLPSGGVAAAHVTFDGGVAWRTPSPRWGRRECRLSRRRCRAPDALHAASAAVIPDPMMTNPTSTTSRRTEVTVPDPLVAVMCRDAGLRASPAWRSSGSSCGMVVFLQASWLTFLRFFSCTLRVTVAFLCALIVIGLVFLSALNEDVLTHDAEQPAAAGFLTLTVTPVTFSVWPSGFFIVTLSGRLTPGINGPSSTLALTIRCLPGTGPNRS